MEPSDSATTSLSEQEREKKPDIVSSAADDQPVDSMQESSVLPAVPKLSQSQEDPGQATAFSGGKLSTNPASDPSKTGTIQGFIREVVELVVVTLLLLIAIRWALAEARYIPSSSMEPTLQINDRLLVEKVSGHLGKKIQRGDILVFYPPPIEMGGKDLQSDPLTVLGRLTGLPFLPYEPAFIKRVVGLPGDEIRINHGQGVFINGQLLDESQYIKEKPNYDLNTLGDIGGRSTDGSLIRPYASEEKDPIIVPAGALFMMGDNRNNSEDSHVWGFLDQKRIVGRACLLFWRQLQPPANSQVRDDQ